MIPLDIMSLGRVFLFAAIIALNGSEQYPD
jgi:hypothetical protein